MNLYDAQALLVNLPDNPSLEQMKKAMAAVCEEEYKSILDDEDFWKCFTDPVDTHPDEPMLIMPANSYVDGETLIRIAQMAHSYATLISIKETMLDRGEFEIVVNGAGEGTQVSTEMAIDGLTRMLRLEVGDGLTMDIKNIRGPYFTDEGNKLAANALTLTPLEF